MKTGHIHHGHGHHEGHGAGQDPDAHGIDPVCGMTVKADSPHQATHAGQDYRFCSAGCRTKFLAEPARYLKPQAAPAETWNVTGCRPPAVEMV